MRKRLFGALASLAVLLAVVGVTSPIRAAETTAFNLPAQPLADALRAVGDQTNHNILFDPMLVKGRSAPALKATLSLDEALNRLLQGTGLTPKYVDAKTIRLVGASSFNPHASDPQADGVQLAHSDDQLEEIIVTAQKRAENLQNVPVSVQVIDSHVLRAQNQNSFADLTRTVPSVHVATSSKSNALSIRGIGSGADNPGFDQAVAIFSDDIYHGRSRMSEATFLDLDRIEILKGPQSIFFGNNAIAGALNVVTKKPSASFEGDVRALYGMFGQYALEAAAGGPLTNSLGARIAVTANGDERGWLDNLNTGEHIPKVHNLAGRLTLVYEPVEDLDATLKLEGSHDKIEGAGTDQPLQWNHCPLAPYPTSFGGFGGCAKVLALGLPEGLDSNNVSLLGGQENRLSNAESVLTLNYRHWDQTFTSITGYSYYDFDLNYNASLLPVPYLQAQWSENYHQFSQEFRVASPAGQPIEYLAGVYFQTDRLAYDQENTFSFLTPLFGGVAELAPYLPIAYRQGIVQREHIYSAFGSLTWNATDLLKMSAGLRASKVEKDYNAHFLWGSSTQSYGGFVEDPQAIQQFIGGLFSSPSLGTSQNLSQSSHALMPSARIQYQLNPDAMAYFRYDRGFLAGGFTGADVTDFGHIDQFGPEHVNAYELGVKSKWLNDTVLLNVDVFRADYTDLQVSNRVLSSNTIGGVTSTAFLDKIANAASSRSQGVEVEAQWAVTRDVRLGANVTYLDARYLSYPSAGQTTLQSYCGSLNQTGYAGTPQCAAFPYPVPLTANLSGQPTAYAPKWSGSLTSAYSMRLPGGMKLTTELDPYFTGSYYFVSGDPLFHVGGYVRLDARLTLEPLNDHWAIDLIGKNLTDRVIITSEPGTLYAAKEQPRNVAVQFRYRWGRQ